MTIRNSTVPFPYCTFNNVYQYCDEYRRSFCEISVKTSCVKTLIRLCFPSHKNKYVFSVLGFSGAGKPGDLTQAVSDFWKGDWENL